jgi:hypothetical protein
MVRRGEAWLPVGWICYRRSNSAAAAMTKAQDKAAAPSRMASLAQPGHLRTSGSGAVRASADSAAAWRARAGEATASRVESAPLGRPSRSSPCSTKDVSIAICAALITCSSYCLAVLRLAGLIPHLRALSQPLPYHAANKQLVGRFGAITAARLPAGKVGRFGAGVGSVGTYRNTGRWLRG